MKKFFSIIPLLIASFVVLGCTAQPEAERIAECLDLHDNVIDEGSCINSIAMEQPTQKEALSICDQIDSGVKNTCYRNVAVMTEDKELCFENDNEIETYICLTNLAGKLEDSSICPEIARKKDEEFCYREVAVESVDASHCEKITDNPEFKETCIGSVEFAKQFEEVPEETSEDTNN